MFWVCFGLLFGLSFTFHIKFSVWPYFVSLIPISGNPSSVYFPLEGSLLLCILIAYSWEGTELTHTILPSHFSHFPQVQVSSHTGLTSCNLQIAGLKQLDQRRMEPNWPNKSETWRFAWTGEKQHSLCGEAVS